MYKKRVNTLYRVSTKKQLDRNENDIPMQRNSCREFIERQGWILQKEFEEKGISGSKVSAVNRDAIQDLKEAAERKEFDILLAFMFDRLGRIEDETPFVLSWFVDHGIEVWSVKEGQQRLDSHADRLINYIRFWQAAGESEKTSIRVKERAQQMKSEGQYTGGFVPYGYRLAHKGRFNKKGEPAKDLEIDPVSSNMVKMIYRMTIVDGYGSYRVANYLNTHGYKTVNDGKFQCNTINRSIKNPIYRGDLILSDGTVKHFEHLRIVSDEEYNRINQIISQHAKANDEKRQVCLSTKGQALLSGIAVCAHCGGKLTTINYKDKKKLSNGIVKTYESIKYYCYHKGRKLTDCDGQTTYRADVIDKAVTELIRQLFSNLSGAPEEEKLRKVFNQRIAFNKQRQRQNENTLKKLKDNLEYLQNEIAASLTGDSVYSPEDLSAAIKTTRTKINDLEADQEALKSEENQKRLAMEEVIPAYNQFKSWSEEFETATLEQKKMIASQLFKRVEIGRDYKINVELNMSYKQFCEEWAVDTEIFELIAV